MKLTTLNKLEKQLRASRGREVPDLKPPPGGWEAINAKLTADSVGVRAPVDQPAIPSWIKWWAGGAGVLLLVVAAVFVPVSMKTSAEQETGMAVQEERSVDRTKAIGLDAAAVAERKVKEEKNDEDNVRERKTSILPGKEKSGALILLAEQPVFAEQAFGLEKQEKEEPVSDRPLSEKTAVDNSVLPDIVDPEPALILLGSDPDELVSVDVDSSVQPEVQEGKPDNFADGGEEAYLPLKLSSSFPDLVLPALQWPTRLMLEVPKKRGIFKRRRIKTRPEWQLHGSVSGFVGEDFDATLAYNVVPAGSSEIFFVRPSGGQIHVEPVAIRGHANRLEQIYLKAGINRQTSSGFLFRSSIGLFRSKSFQIGPRGVLMANEVEVKRAKNETIVPVELGVQYTFLRRRRIKPYAGVHLIGYLNYLGVDESYFTEGATAEEGLVSRFSSREFGFLTPDLAVTLGLQYQISSRISAGAFLWGNVGGNFFVQAPLGVEIRYSLK